MTYIKTEVVGYPNEKVMQRDIAAKEKLGWKVISVQSVGQGYSVSKTCCLGLIFLPLALLGKKKDAFQVTYQHEVKTMPERLQEMKEVFAKNEPPTKPRQ